METMQALFMKNFESHRQAFASLVELSTAVSNAADLLIGALRHGGRLFFCGNGGSAADAQHLAAEFTGRFKFDREPLDAYALHVNTSAITAVGNGFEQIFAREIRAHGRAGDVLVGLSTSGRSQNVVLAMKAARELGIKNIAFTGIEGRDMETLADVLLNVPSTETPRIQEMHIFLGHTLCEIVEGTLYSPKC